MRRLSSVLLLIVALAPIQLSGCFSLFDQDECACPVDLPPCAVTECDGLACVISYQTGDLTTVDAEGDCRHVVCVGAPDPLVLAAPEDVDDDNNPCTIDRCGADGPEHEALPLGAACGTASICSDAARCVACEGEPCFDVDCDADPKTVVQHPAGAVCGENMNCDPFGTCFACDDGSPCTTEECSTGHVVVTSMLPAGTACESDGYCTVDGQCLPCDDGKECTNDQCVGGVPVFTNKPFGTPCGSDDVCQDGQCITFCTPLPDAATCPDTGAYEATDDDWFGQPQFPDDDGAPRPICGVLTPGDVDWISYYAQDEDLETDINDFEFWSFEHTLRLCAFEICDGGTSVTVADCQDGGAPTTGPNGMPGCCWQGDFDTMTYVSMDLTCTDGPNDSGWVHIRIDNPSGSECAPYALLDYGY